MKLYECDKQYKSQADLWEAIKTTVSEIEKKLLCQKLKKNYCVRN